MEYSFDFRHKYLGNHALKISSPKPPKEEQPDYSDISATLVVSDGERELFQKSSKIQGQFWGQNDYGALFVCYKVPGDLPVNRQLSGKIELSGNLQGFLERRGNTVLQMEKYADE